MKTTPFRAFFLVLALLAALSGTTASAQFFKPMRKASDLVKRQPPPRIYHAAEALISPDNARVEISLSQQRAFVYAGDELFLETPISSGKAAGMTPTGNFTIMEKDANHRSNIYGDFVDRGGRVVRSGVSTKIDSAPSGTHYVGAPMRWFMRLTSNGVGMHTGILPGYPASHGCVRLPDEVAKLIYGKVKVGTPVAIVP